MSKAVHAQVVALDARYPKYPVLPVGFAQAGEVGGRVGGRPAVGSSGLVCDARKLAGIEQGIALAYLLYAAPAGVAHPQWLGRELAIGPALGRNEDNAVGALHAIAGRGCRAL